jgi:hypothetical protein
MKASQPFQSGHALAESLCKRAKAESRKFLPVSKKMPAMLAFHKVQDALLDDAESLFNENFKITNDNQTWCLALRAYSLDEIVGGASINALERLLNVFGEEGLNDRPLRELATLWHSKPKIARQSYRRWREQAEKNNQIALQKFDSALAELIGMSMTDLPCSHSGVESVSISPLSDLLALLTISPRKVMTQEFVL